MTLTAEYSDLPRLAVIFGGEHTIYKRSKNAFLKSVNGREISFNDFTLYGRQGKELVYKTPTRFGKVKFLLVDKRLYVLQASILKNISNHEPLDAYLMSFKLLGKWSARPPKHYERY